MNPAQLLAHFECIGEAPEAVPRLRRFILELAVRGKLVPQVDLMETGYLAGTLATQHKQTCEIEDTEPNSEIQSKIPPFPPPHGWNWARVGDVLVTRQGVQIPKEQQLSEAKPGYKRYLYISDFRHDDKLKFVLDQFSEKEVTEGDLVMANTAGPGEVFRGVPGILSNNLFKITFDQCLFTQNYLFIFFTSPIFISAVQAELKGGAQQHLGHKLMGKQFVAIPPLAEQHSIVAKVDELMALCDRLEATQTERENRRDRLVASSLNRLNNGADADAFRAHARFYFNHLPRLTIRPDHIKQLRQTILNLAVRGKLVPQNPTDEPVSSVLNNFNGLYKNRAIRRGVPDKVEESALVNTWKLPPSWKRMSAAELLRLGIIGDIKDGNHGSNHPKTSEFTEKGLPFITAAQVRDQTLDFSGAYKISGVPLKRLRVGFAKAGDVIFTHKGSVGRVAIAPDECVLSPQTTYYRCNPVLLENRYLMWFMTSSAFSAQVDEVKKQTTRDFVAITKQYEFFHAIPPLAEQHRIVAKVDELMALCDQLETQLTTTQSETQKLMEAILHEALAPQAKEFSKAT